MAQKLCIEQFYSGLIGEVKRRLSEFISKETDEWRFIITPIGEPEEAVLSPGAAFFEGVLYVLRKGIADLQDQKADQAVVAATKDLLALMQSTWNAWKENGQGMDAKLVSQFLLKYIDDAYGCIINVNPQKRLQPKLQEQKAWQQIIQAGGTFMSSVVTYCQPEAEASTASYVTFF